MGATQSQAVERRERGVRSCSNLWFCARARVFVNMASCTLPLPHPALHVRIQTMRVGVWRYDSMYMGSNTDTR